MWTKNIEIYATKNFCEISKFWFVFRKFATFILKSFGSTVSLLSCMTLLIQGHLLGQVIWGIQDVVSKQDSPRRLDLKM